VSELSYIAEELREQPTTIVTVGPAGTGKSTLASRLASVDTEIVDTDEIRRQLADDASKMEASGPAFDIAERIVRYRSGHDLWSIVDICGLQQSTRARFADAAEGPVWAVIVEAPKDEAIARQTDRDRSVPRDVIEKQYDKFGDVEFVPGRFDRIIAWQSVNEAVVEVA